MPPPECQAYRRRARVLLRASVIVTVACGPSQQTYTIQAPVVSQPQRGPASPLPMTDASIPALRVADSIVQGWLRMVVTAVPGCYRLRISAVGHFSAFVDLPLGAVPGIVLDTIRLAQSGGIPEDSPSVERLCVPRDTTSPPRWPVRYARVRLTLSRTDGGPIPQYRISVTSPCMLLGKHAAVPDWDTSPSPLFLDVGLERSAELPDEPVRCAIGVRTPDGYGETGWLESRMTPDPRRPHLLALAIVLGRQSP